MNHGKLCAIVVTVKGYTLYTVWQASEKLFHVTCLMFCKQTEVHETSTTFRIHAEGACIFFGNSKVYRM